MFSFAVKRSKFVLAIVVGILVIASGTIFTLAKTGVISIKMLADVTNNATMEIEVQSQQPAPNNAFGLGVMVTATKNGGLFGTASNAVSVLEDGVTKTIVSVTDLSPNTSYIFMANAPECSSSGTFTTGANNTTVRNPLIMACGGIAPPPSTSLTYTLTGNIRDYATKVGIQYATVTGPNGKSPAADAAGSYTLTNISYGNLADLTSHQFTFEGPEHAPVTVYLRTLGIDPTKITNGSRWSGSVYLNKITTGPPPTPPTPGPGTFSFKGRVVYAANPTSGLAGVQVSCRADGIGTVTQTTDSQGYYTFTNFPMVFVNNKSIGSYYFMYFGKIGYGTINKNLGQLGVGEVRASTTALQLKPNVSLSTSPGETAIAGTVKDDAGNLVPGVTINLQKTSGTVVNTWSAISSANALPSLGAGLGQDANYLITNVSRPQTGNVTWVKVNLGNIPTGYIWDKSSGHQGIDLQLSMSTFTKANFTIKKDALTLYGEVKDDKGAYVPNVGVTIKAGDNALGSATSSGISLPPFSTVTNYNYKVLNIPRASAQVTAELTGIPQGYTIASTTVPITLSATGEIQKVDFVLTRYQATIYGTVKDDSGIALPNVTITLKANGVVVGSGKSQAQNVETPGVTEAHNYAILSVPKNTPQISAELSGLPSGNTADVVQITLPATGDFVKQDFSVNKPMPETFTLIGSVKQTRSTTQIDGVDMTVMSLNVTTDANGVATSAVDSVNSKSNNKLNDGISKEHNIRVDNVKRSNQDKYVILFKDKSLGGGLIKKGGYEAAIVPFSSLQKVKAAGNVYSLPEDAFMKKDNMFDWNKYVLSGFLKGLLSRLKFADLIKLFL